MARARNIKPGFFRNADLAELPTETRLLFIGLWTLADREGRLEDRPRQIKMELFPADAFDVGSMLDQLQAAGFLNRYEVDGRRFIEVENFIKHQDPHYKEKASEIPPPPGKENFHKATSVTRAQRQRIMERDGFVCRACGAEDALCIDHILPISRGGDSADENLQVLCSSCNTRKGNKIGDEEKNSRQRRVDVESNKVQRKRSLPSDSLIPDSRFLNPDSKNSEAKASGVPPPSSDEKQELYAAGKSLLELRGMAKAQCGSFITKLAKDYGQEVALEAVRASVLAQPLEATEYLIATCQRLKGERKSQPPPNTVPSNAADVTARLLAEQAAQAAKAVQGPDALSRVAEIKAKLTRAA